MRIKLTMLLCLATSLAAAQTDWLERAQAAEQWIHASQISRNSGTTWPVVPGDTATAANLYSGSPGVVLFYLELHHRTGKADYLQVAKAGADYLVTQLNKPLPGYDEVGLYTGEAGIAFVLQQVYSATRDKKYDQAARKSFQRLAQVAHADGKGVTWRYTDVVYGGAGIGLMLLNWKDNRAAKDLAIKTGRGLISQATTIEGGLRWYMDTAMAKRQYYMPNFSHGTAGVAFFLARLYQETGDQQFLQAALAGAAHLDKIENQDAWIYHHDKDDGASMYYLSWCHGPAGTARLYYLLHQITKEQRWLEKMKKSAAALMQCGLPANAQPGLWNNQGPCCGTAGVAAFFLDMYKITRDEMYLSFAREITQDVVARAQAAGGGIKWVMAEHRRQPDFLQAQTGYMQGAAGIGMWLLHLDEFLRGHQPGVRLPDDLDLK